MKHCIFRICAFALVLLLAACAWAETEIDLLAVDHRLYELGYRDSACNGILDEITVNALRNFQRVNGLEPTGDPDTMTVEVLMSEDAVSMDEFLNAHFGLYTSMTPLADGSYGEAVTRLQQALRELGYFTGSADGAFGEATEAAVCRFQLANGLNETGVADGSVFMRLYESNPVSWNDFLEESCAVAGDSGADVRRLQLWLKETGYYTGECTGRYGDKTQQAVRRFQQDSGLEASGDLDMETCAKLYWDVNNYINERSALRRGDTGVDAEALCRNLAELGYPAHARFNMQSELALMQFQLANRLDVTGIADAATLARLRSENAVVAQDYVPSGKNGAEDADLKQKIARRAFALLGQYSELDSCFDFVQYVALKSGIPLMHADQLSGLNIGAADNIEAGDFLGVEIGGAEICGIATADRALIYRADNGYIVTSYLEAMDAQNIRLYHFSK